MVSTVGGVLTAPRTAILTEENRMRPHSDMEKLKFFFDVRKVIFKDGTSVEAPE